ncbi:hypothetical protein BKA65DRAFT_512746 [Rhexocercosporidium sp. MPI-PUGE-AT-0058]|nr:hypothetical protein BKA65DRAFT_512746 [Rhexocercosporidium sp. MPI-PUGE-AT-0058]
MPPNTRQTDRFTPPPIPPKGGISNTIRRKHFFDAYDSEIGTKSMRAICREQDLDESTGRLWNRQRRDLGSLGIRRTRKLSNKLGRRSKVTPAMCRMLVDPKKNPVRNQLYEAQIVYHNLPCKKR